jgi:hypothetical protein
MNPLKSTPIWDGYERGRPCEARLGEASPIWIVRLPTAPVAHDDSLWRDNCYVAQLAGIGKGKTGTWGDMG